MFWEQLGENLIHGLLLGGVYGVGTMGLSLIFGVMRVVNVGHGAFIMFGAFVTILVVSSLGLSPMVAVPTALIIGIALGLVIFYGAIRRLLKAPELTTLLITFAVGIFLEEIIRISFGADYRGYTWDVGKITLPITTIPMSKIYSFIGSVATAFILYFWFSKTRLGTAVRSVVADAEGARVCGVNVRRIYALSFAIGIGLTVMSGVLLTMFIPVGINPYMGGVYTLKAFVIAVLGGLTSPYGAFFAGLIFGLVENGAYVLFDQISWVEPFSLTKALAFWLLLAILLFKPTGILGDK